MSNFAILRTKKLKTNGQIKSAGLHNSRAKNAENADPDRESKLIAGSDDPLNSFHELIGKNQVKIRSNGVRAIEYMVSFSPEKKGKINVDEWAKDNLKFFEKMHGKQNILSAHLHLDESTPHVHFIIAPLLLNKKNEHRLNCREFLGGKAKLQKLQTDYAAAMAPHGLERGIKGSKAHHKKISDMYRDINEDFKKMEKKVGKAVSSLPEPSFFNFKATFQSLRKIVKKLIKKISIQAGRIDDLTQRNQALQLESSRLKDWVKKTSAYDLEEKLNEQERLLDARHDEINNKLSDDNNKLRNELKTASDELAEVKEQRDKLYQLKNPGINPNLEHSR